jgi:hypothetical protein
VTALGRLFVAIGTLGLLLSILLLAFGVVLVASGTTVGGGQPASAATLLPGAGSVVAFGAVLLVGRRLSHR